MEITKLTEQEIDEQIELFQNRIETISDYILEYDDITVINVLVSQRETYKSTLNLLNEEKRNRLSKKYVTKIISENFIVMNEFENYDCVKIGEQIWMTANLDVDKFRNGDLIREAISNEDWINAGQNFEPAWCYYNNDSNNSKYGKLYNLYAIGDPRGLAPEGWHVADHNEEWRKLTKFNNDKLKSTLGWDNNENGSNETGFAALPGGHRYTDGRFAGLGTNASWWAYGSTDKKIHYSNPHWFIYASRSDFDWFMIDASGGYSVRCVKNYK